MVSCPGVRDGPRSVRLIRRGAECHFSLGAPVPLAIEGTTRRESDQALAFHHKTNLLKCCSNVPGWKVNVAKSRNVGELLATLFQ